MRKSWRRQNMSELRLASGGNRLYALLNIPERCALVGGQILVRSQPLLGTTTTATLYTEYGTIWQKTITAGKSYFIPMLIAPQGGMTLFLGLGTNPIIPGPDQKSTKYAVADEIAVTLPDITPKVLFSGRLMVPEEEYYDWMKIQVNPAEITYQETEITYQETEK
jgi:hypothetical protein